MGRRRLRENNGGLNEVRRLPDVAGHLCLLKSIPVVGRHTRLLTSVSRSWAKGFTVVRAGVLRDGCKVAVSAVAVSPGHAGGSLRVQLLAEGWRATQRANAIILWRRSARGGGDPPAVDKLV